MVVKYLWNLHPIPQMNTFVRLCVVIAMHFLTVGHAALQPLWTQAIGPTPGLSYSVEHTRLDPAGDVIVAGTLTETATGADLWVAKLDANSGAIKWTFRKDGVLNGNDKLGGIAIAANGDVFVAGALISEVVTAGGSGFDSYIARLDQGTGVPIWERPIGAGPVGDDAWHGIAVDAASNPVVTGVVAAIGPYGGDARTAKYDGATGNALWTMTNRVFETQMLDQGERVFVAGDGKVFVQAMHGPGMYQGTTYDQTVVMMAYEANGLPRFANRYREGQSARAYGLVPSQAGGFVVGLSVIVPPGNTPTLTVSRGNPDGTQAIEVPLPLVVNGPFLRAAENGEILFTGRGASAGMVGGRLAPGDLSIHWASNLQTSVTGPGIGFAHADFREQGSVVAGIAPGPTTPDLVIATFDKDGAGLEQIALDGAAPNPPITDGLSGGPTMDSTAFGNIAVTNVAINAVGERIMLVRRLRLFTAPTVSLTNPDPVSPVVTAFSPLVLKAGASDADNDTVRVEFFVDGSSVGAIPTPPFELPYTFNTTGTHTIEAVALDTTGSTTSTGPISLIAHVPIPVVTTGGAQRTGPTTGQFDGVVANLPLGGSARFRFGVAGPSNNFGFTTSSVPIPPSVSAQSVSIPFTIPEPHRRYDYFLEVTATDGIETIVQNGSTQSFQVPNAPVIAQSDFVFFARGKITGNVTSNDTDDDAGEVLTVLYLNPTLPGVFTALNSAFTFAPNRDFTGESLLSYTVNDGFGSVVTQSITLRNGKHYAGTYRALPPVTGTNLGAVNVVVSAGGRATVNGFLNGRRFSGRGELKQQPSEHVGFGIVIRRNGEPDKQLAMSWDVNRNFTADLSEGGSPLYSAQAIRAGESPFASIQRYAMLGSHTNVSGNVGGRVRAFASLRLEPDGEVRFRGKLGDGTSFNTISQVQDDGRIPIYTPLQGRASSFIVGYILPGPASAVSDASGLTVVQSPGGSSVPAYAANYRDSIAFSGPIFIPGSISNPPLTFSTNPKMVTLTTSGGGMGGAGFSLPIWLGKNGQIGGIIGITRISVDGVTGEFAGAFLPAGQQRTLSFSGILRPGQNDGVGVFRGATAAGEVSLAPQ